MDPEDSDEESSPGSDISLDSNEEEEQDEPGETTQDSIYPVFYIDPKSDNPATQRRWTKKELTSAYAEYLESRWTEDPPPAPHDPFTFTGDCPGPKGTEINALSVFARFFDEVLVGRIVEASNAYRSSERFKNRRTREGSYSK
jgi:hypothetical protein